MEPEDLTQFNKAVELFNMGGKASAYQQIKRLKEKYPDDPNLLLWLAFTTPDLKESEEAIQHLSLVDPSNPNLNSARSWLQSEKAKIAPKAPPPPSFAVTPAPPPSSPAPVPSAAVNPPAPSWPALNPTPFQSAPIYNHYPAAFPPSNTPPPVPNLYYPTPVYMPQKVLSGGTVFGYFLLYFFGCLAMLIVVGFLAYLLEPATYSYYYGYRKSFTWGFLCGLLLNLGTTIWATVDASQRRARFGPAVKDTGLSTFLGCILVWIIIFPLYLARRRKNIAYFGS